MPFERQPVTVRAGCVWVGEVLFPAIIDCDFFPFLQIVMEQELHISITKRHTHTFAWGFAATAYALTYIHTHTPADRTPFQHRSPNPVAHKEQDSERET